MKAGGGGAVFGKPQIRRSFSSDTTPPGKPQETDGKENSSNTHTSQASNAGTKISKIDVKLKLVQLEIAEKEACQVLRNLCEEAASILPDPSGGNPKGDSVVPDLLTGVLQLGNFCRRIGHAKDELDKQLENFRRAHDKEIAEKNSLITQLEQLIMRHQADNLKLADELAEATLKHNQKAALLARDIMSLREQVSDLKSDNTTLSNKLKQHEHKLMELPRLEEGYMRTARGMVRQQEISNTMTKIELKKVEEEAKLCLFYKAKAQALQEELDVVKNDLQAAQQQARLNFNKFQQASSAVSNMKLKSKNINGILAKQQTASSMQREAEAKAEAKKTKSRPSSAPALRRSNASIPHVASASLLEDAPDANITLDGELVGSASGWLDGMGQSTGVSTSKRSTKTATRNAEAKLREEVAYLKLELERKAEHIQRLFRQLSQARAYPLLTLRPGAKGGAAKRPVNGVASMDEEELDDIMEMRYKEAAGNFAMSKTMASTAGSRGINVGLDLTPEEEEEELRLAERRVAEAVQLQEDYNDRVERRRDALPAHVKAIRQAKSFAKTDDW